MTQEDTRQEAIFLGRASGGYAGFREQLRVEDQFLRPAKMPRIDAAVDELTDSTLRSAIPGSDLEQLQLTVYSGSRKHPTHLGDPGRNNDPRGYTAGSDLLWPRIGRLRRLS